MTVAVTGRSFSISAGAVTTSSVTLPATINAGDVIYIGAMCSGGSNANMFPVPLGLRNFNLAYIQGGGAFLEMTVYYYYKVANGDEGGTVVSWSATSNERIIEAGVIAGCDLRYGPVFAGAGSVLLGTITPPAPNAPLLTPPWGLAEYLWQVLAVADDGGVTMAGGPVGYDFSVIRTEPGTDNNGLTSGYADKVSTAASEDPASYTKTAAEENAAITAAWLAATVEETRPVLWHSVESITLATSDITITIPAGENRRLIVGVNRGTVPTSVMLDPGGLSLPLEIVDDGVASASHDGGGAEFTTLWELPAADTPTPGSYVLRLEFAGAAQRVVNTLVLSGIDTGEVESVTVTVDDLQMASFSVPTVGPSCTILTYASRVAEVGVTREPFTTHDLDGFPLMQYGCYYTNAASGRGAVPMVRKGLTPGSHTFELDVAEGSNAVVALTLVLRELVGGDDPIWASTVF